MMTVKRRSRILAAIAFAGLAVTAICLAMLYGRVAQPQTAPATVGGPFALTNAAGQTVTDRDLRGHFLLVYFGYTFCPDICPTTLADVTQALRQMGKRGDAIQPIFITVDPERDTPSVMGRYTAAFSPRLLGLTGSPAELRKVEAIYHVVVRPGASPTIIDHSAVLYLMGPDGQFLAPLAASTPPAALAADLTSLIRR